MKDEDRRSSLLFGVDEPGGSRVRAAGIDPHDSDETDGDDGDGTDNGDDGDDSDDADDSDGA
jgi:hypothetical protein